MSGKACLPFLGGGHKPNEMAPRYTNALSNETSPYLLQHAHNPVNWEPWSHEVLEKAKAHNKPLLISIGYAACHWCHVMERECFENEEVARAMNANFINIKVDREERPDVDHIYMDALQMMTGGGGWPLNIIALPDGRPFWGATYVQKENWIKVLGQLSELYRDNPEKIIEYAQNLSEGIRSINLVEMGHDADIIPLETVKGLVKDWSAYFDSFLGGYKRAPKFMMPVNLNFLLHFGTYTQDGAILEYVHTTLTRMAWGGIFDPIEGGFSRYSVDIKWHVPHFEKMLYDNGQLVSLYAQVYAATQNELYKETVARTLDFVTTGLMDEKFGFYASLDADSLNADGKWEEGAYYVWTQEELNRILGQDYAIFKDYYNINDYGLWEHGNYVLIRDATDIQIAEKHAISITQLNNTLERCRLILKKERAKRSKPRLDDKILTSWNGLMLKGLIDAYRYIGNSSYLDLALKNADFIHTHLTSPDGGLDHVFKKGKGRINGYLEDYASVIDAYIGMYEITFDEKWLFRAKNLADYCTDNYFDTKSGLFFFTSKQDDNLIRRTMETADNVIPSSNSMMAKNLFKLGKFFSNEKFGSISLQMLKTMQENIRENAQSHANWLQLALYVNQPFYEIAVIGENYEGLAKELNTHYMPNTVIAAIRRESNSLPMLQKRYAKGKTWAYVCLQESCRIPVSRIEDVLAQIRPSALY